jgi:chorismate-pyruvate lyase
MTCPSQSQEPTPSLAPASGSPEKTCREFNPFQELLQNRDVRSLSLDTVNLREFSPFQRTLLALDGTVTKYLEAYTLEPIEVVRLRQETQRLKDPHHWLEIPPDTETVAREVLLRGAYSGIVYAYAVSLLVPERLPGDWFQLLDSERGGIGRALLSNQVESRRKLLWYGREQLPELPEDIRALTGAEFLSRSYCIILGGKPVMLINEKFPIDVEIHLSTALAQSFAGDGRA